MPGLYNIHAFALVHNSATILQHEPTVENVYVICNLYGTSVSFFVHLFHHMMLFSSVYFYFVAFFSDY